MWELGKSIQVLPGYDRPLRPLFSTLCRRVLPPPPEWSEMRLLLCFHSISTKINLVCSHSSSHTINLWQQTESGSEGVGPSFIKLMQKSVTFINGCRSLMHHVRQRQQNCASRNLLHLLYYCAFPRFPSTWKRATVVMGQLQKDLTIISQFYKFQMIKLAFHTG